MAQYKPNLEILKDHDLYCDLTEASAYYYCHLLRMIEIFFKNYPAKNYELSDEDIEECRERIYQYSLNVFELMDSDSSVKQDKSFTFTISLRREVTNKPIVVLITVDEANSHRKVITTAGLIFSYIKYLHEKRDFVPLEPYDFNSTY